MDISASVMVPITAGIEDELESSTGDEHIARSCKLTLIEPRCEKTGLRGF